MTGSGAGDDRGGATGASRSPLRERAIEITREYWATRDSGMPERVAVAQLILALARADLARDEAYELGRMEATEDA